MTSHAPCAAALCLAACLGLSPLPAGAADGVNLEGTWKISAPQESLRPVRGEIPFTQLGRERYQENKRNQAERDYDEYDIATSRCASPGLPRLMITPERFRVWQRPGLIVMQFEWNRLFRQIDTGLTLPRNRITEDDEWVGRAVPISMGRWEGATLLVTTEGFGVNTLIDNLTPHGYGMKLTERIRLKDADTLEDRITIEDPEYFTRPWEAVVTYKRQLDAAFAEDVCLDRLADGPLTLSGKLAGSAQAQPVPDGTPPGASAPPPDLASAPGPGAPRGAGGPPPDGGFGPKFPPLPANAPEPPADPRDLDGTWFHAAMLEFQIKRDMFAYKVPLNAAGQKVLDRRIDSLKKGAPFLNASARCLPPGPPWQMDLNMPFQIFQSKDRFDVLFEEYHGAMQIVMDPAKSPPAGYMGRSVARWDGDTLVVETSGFKDALWLDVTGTPASKNAKLTQRIRKVKTDHSFLEVIFTLDDPTYYTRPWSWARDYDWRPDYAAFREYNCEEQTGAENGLDPSLVAEPRD